jgi:thioredoxin-like negative regulator of GroEL
VVYFAGFKVSATCGERAMTNEEAKEIYTDATAKLKAGDAAGALALLDALDAARPNSRQVTYNRGLCLVRLDRIVEADDCLAKLKGKIEADKLADLEAAINTKRAVARQAESNTAPPAATPGGPRENVIIVESTFPVSTTEATVTGHVQSGVFHLGDTVTITTDSGMPVLAPIRRIGTADSPLKLVREGQKAVLLLEVEPHFVRSGGRLVSQAQDDAYAKTMMVGTASGGAQEPEELSAEVMRLDRDVKAGRHAEAKPGLDAYLAANPGSKIAHRLMARLLLDSEEHRNTAKALEHVQKAYELGGANDPAVIDTLAAAMGENGEGEHGLRFLERQADNVTDPTARAAIANRVLEYRKRYNLGHVWEFSDSFGDVVFETKDLAEAAAALKKNTIPRNGKVRRDRVGEWRDIETALAGQSPEIAALFQPAAAKGGVPPIAIVAIIAVIVIAAAAFFLMQ